MKPMQRYAETRRVVGTTAAADDEVAFVDRLERPSSSYDPALNKPGQLCANVFCRAWIPGGAVECSSCRMIARSPSHTARALKVLIPAK